MINTSDRNLFHALFEKVNCSPLLAPCQNVRSAVCVLFQFRLDERWPLTQFSKKPTDEAKKRENIAPQIPVVVLPNEKIEFPRNNLKYFHIARLFLLSKNSKSETPKKNTAHKLYGNVNMLHAFENFWSLFLFVHCLNTLLNSKHFCSHIQTYVIP